MLLENMYRGDHKYTYELLLPKRILVLYTVYKITDPQQQGNSRIESTLSHDSDYA